MPTEYSPISMLLNAAIQLRQAGGRSIAAQESLLGAHLRLLEVMQATVQHLVQQIAMSKLSL